MEKLQTVANFSNDSGIMPMANSVSVAVPGFWSILLFFLWIFAMAGQYMAIAKAYGKKRFWQSAVAMSFVFFLASLLVVSMNTAAVQHLHPYWVGFYITMVLLSWLGLRNYK